MKYSVVVSDGLMLKSRGTRRGRHATMFAVDVLQRWWTAHAHEPPLHTGVQMRRAIAERFDLRDVHGAAYLYRYVTKHLPHDVRGVARAQYIYSTERRGVAERSLNAVGLGIVAVRA